MQLQQIDVTGARVIGAITTELGNDGPKHHAVVLGRGIYDGLVYVAEFKAEGYQVATFEDFRRQYAAHGHIRVEADVGPFSNLDVAKRALQELMQGQARYDIAGTSSECYVNRAMHGKSISSQMINTAIGILFVVGAICVLRSSK